METAEIIKEGRIEGSKLVKDEESSGLVKLYKLSSSVLYDGNNIRKRATRYVVVSSLESAFDTNRPETYIFPANRNGKILDWSELSGSFRGGIDHAKALKGLGFEIIDKTVH